MTTVGSVHGSFRQQLLNDLVEHLPGIASNTNATQSVAKAPKLPTPSAGLLRAYRGLGESLETISAGSDPIVNAEVKAIMKYIRRGCKGKEGGEIFLTAAEILNKKGMSIDLFGLANLDPAKAKAIENLVDPSGILVEEIGNGRFSRADVNVKIKGLLQKAEALHKEGKIPAQTLYWLRLFGGKAKNAEMTTIEDIVKDAITQRYEPARMEALAKFKEAKATAAAAAQAAQDAHVSAAVESAVKPLKAENASLKASLENTQKAAGEAATASKKTIKKIGTFFGKKFKALRGEKEALEKSLSHWKWGAIGVATLAVGGFIATKIFGKKEPEAQSGLNQQA